MGPWTCAPAYIPAYKNKPTGEEEKFIRVLMDTVGGPRTGQWHSILVLLLCLQLRLELQKR